MKPQEHTAAASEALKVKWMMAMVGVAIMIIVMMMMMMSSNYIVYNKIDSEEKAWYLDKGNRMDFFPCSVSGYGELCGRTIKCKYRGKCEFREGGWRMVNRIYFLVITNAFFNGSIFACVTWIGYFYNKRTYSNNKTHTLTESTINRRYTDIQFRNILQSI